MGTRTFSMASVTGFVASGSFVLPVDYDASGSLTILCIGGGGGGEKRATSSGGGGGGGGGSLARGSFSGLQPGRTIYYSIGFGGTGGQNSGGASGSNGTDSWVNINSNATPTSTSDGVLAKGGSGGSATSGGSGGGTGSIGSLGTAFGGAGGSGGATNGAGGGGGGGINSGSFAGTGGNSAANITETTGNLANNYGYSSGGGGGGGGSNNGGSTGGNGGNGYGFDSSLVSPRSYGGGGGGGGSGVSASGNGGNGGEGIIIITYTSKENMLPTTNLSFTNIQSYFGGSNPIQLTEYYRNTGVVSQYAKNNSGTLIPASGQISVNNFRGAPYKLYRQIDAGALISYSKFFTSVTTGYSSGLSIGAINSNAFTLSGGTSVSITDITKQNVGPLIFRVSSASAVSNSGWDYLIIEESTSTNVYPRTDATFESGTTVSTWTWTATQFLTVLDYGSDYVIKFV
jgi:hypothetical protein